MKEEELHTVCQEAGCPNIFECWEDREATFLIGGSQCTRRCDFCQIDTGKPADYDTDEPRRVAESVTQMNLRYATVTGVARDDLPDEGAWLHAETVRQIHEQNPAPASRSSRPTSRATPTCWASCSSRARRCSRTTSRRCRGSSSASARRSATSARSTSSRRRARRAHHQVEPHPRHGRGAARGQPGAAGPARRRHRHHHDHAVPAARPRGTCRSRAGCGRRSSSSSTRRRRRSDSSACSPARSCARATARDACGRARCRRRAARSRHSAHLADASSASRKRFNRYPRTMARTTATPPPRRRNPAA